MPETDNRNFSTDGERDRITENDSTRKVVLQFTRPWSNDYMNNQDSGIQHGKRHENRLIIFAIRYPELIIEYFIDYQSSR